MKTTTQPKLKWKRRRPGKYAAATPCGHTVLIERWGGYYGWIVYFEGGYRVAPYDSPTLARAKERAAIGLDTLRWGWEKRQADEAAKIKAETDKRIAEKIYHCRLRDSNRPPAGVPWYEWATRFVGCTRSDVAAMNAGPTPTDVLNDWMENHCTEEAYSIIAADLDKWFREVYAVTLEQALEENAADAEAEKEAAA